MKLIKRKANNLEIKRNRNVENENGKNEENTKIKQENELTITTDFSCMAKVFQSKRFGMETTINSLFIIKHVRL